MSNFCTVVLTSTRQHFGFTDIDKLTISDTLSKSKLIRDSYKLVHIKTQHNDQEVARNKRKWFEARGFEVLETFGNWSNDHESHGRGLLEDMSKVYTYPKLMQNEYVINLENDWRFNVDNLDSYLYHSIDLLHKNPFLLYHRHTRIDQQHAIIKRLEGIGATNYRQDYITTKEFSFNPFISRTRDMRYIAPFALRHPHHSHCEMNYELTAKYLFNQDYLFSFTDNGIVEHLGSKEFCDKNRDVKIE